MSEETILAEIEANILLIQQARKEIADLKEKKINKKSEAWAYAEGSAKEKEDYTKAYVSEFDREIAYKEANIEYLYSKNALLNDKLVYIEDE